MPGGTRANRRLKAKYKRLLTELEYLYSELEFHQEEHTVRKEEFQEEFLEFCEEHGYDCTTRKTHEAYEQQQFDPYKVHLSEDEERSLSDDLFDNDLDPQESEKDLKNLYKKIATKTHPDKLLYEDIEGAKERKKKMFLEAQSALQEENYYKMLQLAKELGIELPEPNEQQVMWMRAEKKKIEKIISGITQTFEWVYGEENPSMPKVNLFYRYVDIIGCVKLQKEIRI